MKIKLLLLACGLVFSMPGFAAANHSIAPNEVKAEHGDMHGEGHHRHHMSHQDWQAKMAEREQKILTWVDQYTPEKKAEWTAVFAEKKTLVSKWMSPENKAKREKWKKEKMAQWEKYKNDLEKGKITKEEFFKKTHKGMKMKHWQTFHDIEVAVTAKNDKQAAELLNTLLAQCKEHNEKMKQMLNK